MVIIALPELVLSVPEKQTNGSDHWTLPLGWWAQREVHLWELGPEWACWTQGLSHDIDPLRLRQAELQQSDRCAQPRLSPTERWH